MSVEELLAVFEHANIKFAYVVRRNGELQVSHKVLEPLRDLILRSPGFADHEAVFIGRNPRFKTLFFAFVHNTNRGLSQGGLRVMKYADLAAVLKDGLRLAEGMSRKNAVSGLWWGGGKGVIPITEELIQQTFDGDEQMKDQTKRNALFKACGKFIAKLNGVYYTAADIGTYNRDMKAILATNRFVTCIPPKLGGSGDPSPHTAEGVFRAIRATREHLTGSDNLTGVTIAVQGAGKVGRPLVEKLVNAGAAVFVSDAKFEADESALKEFQAECPTVKIISCGAGHENDIFGLEVEIIAPCALGGTINQQTIEQLKPTVKIVCGGANNILGNEDQDGELLYRKGIVYIPDFVCNWMGIVNCANEVFGYLEEDVKDALENVAVMVKTVLEKAEAEDISHTAAAHQLADDKIKEVPPDELRRNRGQRIIAHLINDQQSTATYSS
jgi:glutamate dehydrogenase/leucine dehydrogenase